jgi:hypothetical protein
VGIQKEPALLETGKHWLSQDQWKNTQVETPTERRTRERRREIKEHRQFLKRDGRFREIVQTIQRLQDGPERREALRNFWNVTYADAMVQAVRGDPLGIMPGVLHVYMALDYEERRETGREFQAIHPHAPQDSTGSRVFPLQEVMSTGVARLQE